MAQPARTESSTIISIGELMQMEQHRIDDEKKREEQKRLAHESALRAARVRREQELEEHKRSLDAARREREEVEMHEAAAIAGKLLGFIASAKVHAEHEANEKARQKEHERAVDLARAKVAARIGVIRWALAAVSIGAVLTIGALIGTYAGFIAPAQDRRIASLQAQLNEQNTRVVSLDRDLQGARADKDRAEAEGAELRSKLATADRQLKVLRTQLDEKALPAGHGPPPKVVPPEETGTPCDRWDPLCNLNGRM